MSEWVKHLEWWHWMVAAVLFAALETFVPGAVIIWFAASAGFVGLLLTVFAIPWQFQLIGFALLGAAAAVLYRAYLKRHPLADEQPNLNLRGQQYVGSELVLIEPIEQGAGKARVGDGVWKVAGPELPAGARVRVTGANGTILTVVAI
jgi:membrane protein implicated in regulation of membrane protease activity